MKSTDDKGATTEEPLLDIGYNLYSNIHLSFFCMNISNLTNVSIPEYGHYSFFYGGFVPYFSTSIDKNLSIAMMYRVSNHVMYCVVAFVNKL